MKTELCEHCGAKVAAGSTACAYCGVAFAAAVGGAPAQGVAVSPRDDHEKSGLRDAKTAVEAWEAPLKR